MSNLIADVESFLAATPVPFAGRDLRHGAILCFADDGLVVECDPKDLRAGKPFVGIAKRAIEAGEAIIWSGENANVVVQGVYTGPVPSYYLKDAP